MNSLKSAALSAMAAAMACIEAIHLWSVKTLNIIVRAGLEIYRDARVVHQYKPIIRMHDMPRKITINDVVLTFAIEWPVITESELNVESMQQFFTFNPMAYLVVRERSSAIFYVAQDEIYLFEPFPNVDMMLLTSNNNALFDSAATWVCVLRFTSFSELKKHIWDNNFADQEANVKQCQLTLGAIRCSSSYPNTRLDSQVGSSGQLEATKAPADE